MGSNFNSTTNRLAHAINEIETQANTSVSIVKKGKSLRKFGENETVGTVESTIMQFIGGEVMETYVADNLINAIVSDSALNTQEIALEGHYYDDNDNLVFVTQEAILTGQTSSPLSIPLSRLTRMYNNSGVSLALGSNVYGYENTSTLTGGVPNDATKVHCIIEAHEEQSLKGATALSYKDWALITEVGFSVNKKAVASVDFRIRVAEQGKVFRTLFKFSSTNTSGLSYVVLDPVLIVPPNSDIILTGVSNVVDTDCTAGFNSYLAIDERYL